MFKFDGFEDGIPLDDDVFILGLFIVNCTENFYSFCFVAVIKQPAWRLGQCENEDNDHDRKDDLESNRKAPSNCAANERHAKVEPICKDYANRHEEDFCGNETPTRLAIAELRLIPVPRIISCFAF